MDFWAYACINCQRANQHVTTLYDTYHDYGLQVVGLHAPEYGFEHEAANVQAATKEQNIHYPVAQDNDFATWKNYNNRYWPAHYLIDSHGKVRQIHEGEGAYADTEKLVRTLLKEANPDVELPDPIETSGAGGVRAAEGTEGHRNPETYLGTARARYYANPGSKYVTGVQTFEEVEKPDRYFLYAGRNLESEERFYYPGCVRGCFADLEFPCRRGATGGLGAWRIEGYLPRWQYQGHSCARCSGFD